MELPGNRKRGRPKRRFMDMVKEEMAEVEGLWVEVTTVLEMSANCPT